jgi:endonuclease/exonuclease/phosphatase family metal-dependent hydrolase
MSHSRARTSLPARRGLRARGSALLALAVAAGALVLTHQPAVAAEPTSESATTGTPAEPRTFRVGTFNVLGASHTVTPRRGFPKYPVRMRRTVQLINQQGLDVVGFQEYQWRQHELFVRLTGGSWGVWPGLDAGRGAVQNSIVWRTENWELVEAHFVKVPYFRGRLGNQPYVKLRDKHTGKEVWVINTHHPANSRGPAGRWRARAVAIHATLVNQLQQTGLPVFLVGDFNDRAKAFCGLTRAAPGLTAANGGHWADGVCVPPPRMKIDWVFLTKDVDVHRYVHFDNWLTNRTSDHPLIYSEVSVG